MIKIFHTADVHFGVENYGRTDPATGHHTRLLDFVKAFNYCIDKAIEEKADLFILAGDAFKTPNPTPTHQKYLLRSLLRLQQEKIEVVIVVGNHDHPLSFGKVHALDVFSDIPVQGFHVFSRPEAKVIQTKSGPVSVVGISWPMRQHLMSKEEFVRSSSLDITEKISQAVAAKIKSLAASLDPSIPAVLTGHLTVSNGVFSGSEKRAVFGTDPLFLPSELGIEPFNYVALGHLHRHQSLNVLGRVPVVYSGSLERIDFGEVRDQKGFVVAEIDTIKNAGGQYERICNWEQRLVPTRKMLQLNLLLDPDVEFFTKQLLDQIATYDLSDSIVKLFYHLPPNRADTVDQGLILRSLSDAWCVAGVVPVRKNLERHARISLAKGSDKLDDPEELLGLYFSKKIENSDHTRKMIQKSLMILEEVKNCCADSEK